MLFHFLLLNCTILTTMKLLRSSIFLLLASTRRSSAQYCGCSSCTEAIWTTPSTDASGTYPCGDRIQWLQTELGYDETAACVKVSGEEFPDRPCGPVCNPEAVECNPPAPIRCGCSTCSDEVWSGTSATDGGGTHSCGARIEWLQSELGYSENDTCGIVGGKEFPDICGLCDPNMCDTPRPTLAPTEPPSPEDPSTFACGCESCTDEVLDNLATDASGTYSCGSRINWLQSEQSFTEQSACALVSEQFPSICGTACHPFECDTETKSPSPTFESTPLPSYVLNGDDTVVSNGASALVVTNAKIDDTISIGGTPRTSPLAIYVWVNDKNGMVCPQPTYAGSSWPLILLGGDYRIEEGVDCVAQMLQGTNVPFLCCNSPEHGFLPMYQFVGDSSPIDVNGEGLGEVWFSIPSSTTATPSPTRAETSSPVASPIDDAPCPNTDNMPSCPVPNLFEESDWTITNECVIESGVYTFRKLIITNGSTVVVRPDADVSMNVAGGILVNDRAALFVGCPTDPFLGAFDVTFTGGRSDLASGERWIKVGTATWANALVVENAKLEIHGRPKTSWTSLIKTATPGDTSIELATPTAWQPGDEVIVVQSSSNRDEVERRTIASANGNVLQLTEALEHTHEGGFVGRGTRLNAEVGMLSHNIRFHGSFDWNQCQSNFRGDGLPINGEEAKSECFGGILTFLKESAVHIENAEFDRLGQGLAMGRYPLHWHLAENVQGSYVRNVAVHSSANRCVVSTRRGAIVWHVCLLTLFQCTVSDGARIICRNNRWLGLLQHPRPQPLPRRRHRGGKLVPQQPRREPRQQSHHLHRSIRSGIWTDGLMDHQRQQHLYREHRCRSGVRGVGDHSHRRGVQSQSLLHELLRQFILRVRWNFWRVREVLQRGAGLRPRQLGHEPGASPHSRQGISRQLVQGKPEDGRRRRLSCIQFRGRVHPLLRLLPLLRIGMPHVPQRRAHVHVGSHGVRRRPPRVGAVLRARGTGVRGHRHRAHALQLLRTGGLHRLDHGGDHLHEGRHFLPQRSGIEPRTRGALRRVPPRRRRIQPPPRGRRLRRGRRPLQAVRRGILLLQLPVGRALLPRDGPSRQPRERQRAHPRADVPPRMARRGRDRPAVLVAVGIRVGRGIQGRGEGSHRPRPRGLLVVLRPDVVGGGVHGRADHGRAVRHGVVAERGIRAVRPGGESRPDGVGTRRRDQSQPQLPSVPTLPRRSRGMCRRTVL
ncbi:hypothetical protein ACHAWF_009600 [Thalassiosira exigua]